jgi:hypothetical protein
MWEKRFIPHNWVRHDEKRFVLQSLGIGGAASSAGRLMEVIASCKPLPLERD